MNSRTRTPRAGFTLIEVMMAVAIITIGATGLFAMQGATVRANSDASESTVATNFAATWIERLKRDALSWTQSGNAALMANTQLLRTLAPCADNTGWAVPVPRAQHQPFESAAADSQGFDVDMTQPANQRNLPFYCANVSVSEVHGMGLDTTLPILPGSDADLLRVTVRVWWARGGRGGAEVSNMMLSPAARGCVVPSDAELAAPTLRTTYLSTLVHWNRYR